MVKRPKSTATPESRAATPATDELPSRASCKLLADEPARLHTSDQSELKVSAMHAYVESGTNSTGNRLKE